MTDRDRLIELVDKAKEEYAGDVTDHTETDYIVETLLNEGVILPPCKVGTEVLGVFDNDDEHKKEIYCGKVLCFTLDECNVLWAKMKYACGLSYWHTIDDFGKTVFLTKEEAEQKLKEREW